MTVHLSKMAVGCDSLAVLEQRQRPWLAVDGHGRQVYRHRTRFLPKRAGEVLDGGSLYWVIRKQMLARQSVLAFEQAGEGTEAHVLIHLDPTIVPVQPIPRRVFQGWRYLEPDEAPADISAAAASGLAALPAALVRDLRALALL